ncbi:MAG: hypothetical protein AAGA18_14935 [Verrucomicrobiota bacterium]
MIHIDSLCFVSRKLDALGINFAFVDGGIIELLVDEPSLIDFRPTIDVDVIVEAIGQYDYSRLEEKFREAGFENDTREDAPICRWILENITVDIMPIEATNLGLNCRWFPEALTESITVKVQNLNTKLKVISQPYFIATKVEAFKDRGNKDFYASHDIEDLITLIDGCSSIVSLIKPSSKPLKTYLRKELSKFMNDSNFQEAIAGHLPPDSASQQRLPIIIERIKGIIMA